MQDNTDTPPTATDTLDARQQLDALTCEFATWRANKRYPRQSIPMSLLRKAQQLTEVFSAAEVQTRLGVSAKQLHRATPSVETTAPSPQFVTVETPTIPTSAPSPQATVLSLEITLPGGEHILMQHLSPKGGTGAFIAHLLQGLC